MIKLNKITISILLLTVLFMSIVPEMAFAGGLKDALNKAVQLVCTDVIKAIAVAAIIAVGMGALMGRLQWGVVAIVICGLAIMFSAPKIVTALYQDPGVTGC